MAKIKEEVVVVKFSKLVRKGEDGGSILTPEIVEGIEAMASELVDDTVVVEVVLGEDDED